MENNQNNIQVLELGKASLLTLGGGTKDEEGNFFMRNWHFDDAE